MSTACAPVDTYTNHSFRQRERERERERGIFHNFPICIFKYDDIAQTSASIQTVYISGSIELNFIIVSVVEDGSI